MVVNYFGREVTNHQFYEKVYLMSFNIVYNKGEL